MRLYLGEKLGEGLNSEVYRGWREDSTLNLRQDLAVKILKSENHVEILRREFASLASVRSGRCARLLGFEWVRRRPAMLIELIDGCSLRELHLYENLDANDWQYLFYQVSAALGELHEYNIAHGDLSPGNIMIDSQGEVRLIDFGWANTELGFSNSYYLTEPLAEEIKPCERDRMALKRMLLDLAGTQIGKGFIPSVCRRRSIGEKVQKIQRRRQMPSTISNPKLATDQKPAARFALCSAISLALACSLLSGAHARVSPLAGSFELRTRSWVEITVDKRLRKFSPTGPIRLEPGEHLIEWSGPAGSGRRTLTIRSGLPILWTDQDLRMVR